MKYYTRVIVGGTFDRFHLGHQSLLNKTFKIGERVWLGITTDEFTGIKIPNPKSQIQSFLDRKKAVENYFKQKDWLDMVVIVPIVDRFGTTLVDENLEAIVVSPETELVATEINLLRAQKNWPALDVVVVPWVLAKDGKPINSVRIRNGEIDREGELFALTPGWGLRKLPQDLRLKFKKPFGRLIKSSVFRRQSSDQNSPFPLFHKERVPSLYERGGQEGFLLITVGDAVTHSVLQQGIIPQIAVVDLYIKRKKAYQDIQELGFKKVNHYKEKNPAGTLSYQVYHILKRLIRDSNNHLSFPRKRESSLDRFPVKPGMTENVNFTKNIKSSVLEIEGEDDLVTLFAIFIAPLDSIILYGQPDEGVVMVEVTEDKKKKVRNYIEQFTL